MIKAMLQNAIKRISNPPLIVPVVRMDGVIMGSSRFQESLNLQSVAGSLKKAFNIERAPAVAIVVNSPGGSPTYSKLIHDQIRFLAKKHNKKVYIFVEELAASGGYWIACAGDVIYGLPTSIIGSIGVVFSGFGFDKIIEKYGISRRIYTAGEKKAFMDSFSSESPEDVKRLKGFQEKLHQAFIDHVVERRGEKLNADDHALFTGEFWLGEEAKSYGLIDGIGEMQEVLEQDFGSEIKIRLLEKSRNRLRELVGLRGSVSSPLAWCEAVEYRAMMATMYGRFGR